MTKKTTDVGTNRTGVAASPIDARRLAEAAADVPFVASNDKLLEAERVFYARAADPVGTVPLPTTVTGIARSVIELVEGHEPRVLVDKLGERLAYERTGVRLYDALLAKYEAASVHEGGPKRAELEKIRSDEHAHLLLLRDALRQLGADPTAVTPCADVMGVAAQGWIAAISDPRTTLAQCLDVMLVVEAGDVAGWSILDELADELGLEDLAAQFRSANIVEEQHALQMRGWLAATVLGQAGVHPTPPRESAQVR